MPDQRDHYKVLQVDSEADPDVIQAAFRRLAQKSHPDLAPAPEGVGQMAAINGAWEVLRDPARRAAYDVERSRGAHSALGSVTGDRAATSGGAAHGVDAAGPPPGNPSGSVVNFGRYARWSLGEIARRDLEYIEWLDRMPIGRPYRAELDQILRQTGRRRGPDVEATERRGLFRRR